MLDAVKAEFCLFTDRSLAKLLGVTPNEISTVRTHHTALSADLILRVHHATGWGVDYIRGLAGDESEGFFERPVGGRFYFKWGNEL